MKAAEAIHPLHYRTLPARQNARSAFWRRLRAMGWGIARFVALAAVGAVVAGLAAYGAVVLAERTLNFFITR